MSSSTTIKASSITTTTTAKVPSSTLKGSPSPRPSLSTLASSIRPLQTTTTTKIPSPTPSPGAVTSKPNPLDPHVDYFLSQRCGKEGDDGLQFWTWCSSEEERSSKEFVTKCLNIEGTSNVVCDVKLQFIGTTKLKYSTLCPIPGKPVTWKDHEGTFKAGQYNEVVDYCQETLRSFNSLPLWLILIIVFMVIAAVATTAVLFWRYWLRKRLYPAEYGLASSMDSRFTSAVSSASSMGSAVPPSGSALPKLSLRSSPAISRTSGKQSSSPGSTSGTGNSGVPSEYASQRVISLAPTGSQRPASRAFSRAASSSPVSGAQRSIGSISSQGSHKSHRSHSSRSKSGSHSDKGRSSSSAVKFGSSSHQISSSRPGSSHSNSRRASSTSPAKLGSSSTPLPNPPIYPSDTPTSTAMSKQL